MAEPAIPKNSKGMTNKKYRKGGTTKRTQRTKRAQNPEKTRTTHFEIHGMGKRPNFLHVMGDGGGQMSDLDISK